MNKPYAEEVSESEIIVFKKKLKNLSKFKGRGTELISQYIPPGTDRGSVMDTLNNEISQSSNIKSPQTRKNVQGALRKIIGFIKDTNYKIPATGLVIFAGNISEQEGKTNIKLFVVKPLRELKSKIYWCDSEFHLEPLKEMIKPSEIFGLIAIDKNESTIATLSGKKYEIIGHYNSGVAGKTRAGGQSAHRFERLREEATHNFYKRIAEKINEIFLPYGDNLNGLIVGGPGMTKKYFLNENLIDHRLNKLIIGTVDTSYTDESGIREVVQRSDELLRNTELMRETEAMNKFLEEIAKDRLAVYGQKQTEEALMMGKIDKLLLSEALEWEIHKSKCSHCGNEEELLVKDPLKDAFDGKCPKCNYPVEVIEESDYLDHMLEKATQTGAEVKIISTDTPEGMQFFKGFGGVGGMLRYR